MKIDSHQHFWKFDPVRDSWIDESMQVIQRDFFPQDLHPVLARHGISGCVVVQSDQSPAENVFQLENAASYDFVKGVVGWVDLQAGDIYDQLAQLAAFKKMKGFRHVLQGETDRALMLKPSFMRGISALSAYGFTYDILIFPDQLHFAAELAKAFPGQPFVLDHIAKPGIKKAETGDWKTGLETLARFENISCKVSGMVTEADWQHWKISDFTPYLDVVFDAFGADRLMFGSDWPVCEVAGGYDKMIGIVTQYTSKLSVTENEKFWGGNAIKFYNLD
ncbi:amidohydrolase family protein [Hufsiella ginkgonis]|uniref:Amidohydrolase family protein n=1 Tax=Hufsiella ginkgonis TaxID=2695274 RepID=A0A7K1Y3J6_9SPHI|nr:amidohydrolase family protein [Hufsiella ginkgonis]